MQGVDVMAMLFRVFVSLDAVVLAGHLELLEAPAEDSFEECPSLAQIANSEIEVRRFHAQLLQ